MTRRRLRPEAEELWRKVASKAERLHPEKKFTPEDFVERPAPKPKNVPVFDTRLEPADSVVHPRTTVRAAP